MRPVSAVGKVRRGPDAAIPHQLSEEQSMHISARLMLFTVVGWLGVAASDVRADRPKLTRWYETFRTRPSMQATEPHA